MPDSIFKVRDRATGLFSGVGYDPYFSTEGKSWKTLGQAILALKLYKRGRWDRKNLKIPQTWEIVEYQMKLTPVKTLARLEGRSFMKNPSKE